MKRLILLLMFAVSFGSMAYAQKDTVYVEGYWEAGEVEGTLNDAINAAKNGGTINNTVFKLTQYDQYVLTSRISLGKNENLEIVADKPGSTEESAPPQILWSDDAIDEAFDNTHMIQTLGDIVAKNVWFVGGTVSGTQLGTSITFEDSLAENDAERGYFDGVIFDYFGIGGEGSGTISVKADHFTGIFKNCYFRNHADDHFQYYGRAVSFPYQSIDFHYDSLLFENTTFSNLGRIVMMEGNEYGSNIHLNHVTMINSVEWVIQSGWLENMSITNSIFVNPYMFGPRVLDICDENQDYDDWLDGDCVDGEPGVLGGGLVQDIVPTDSLGFVPDADKDGTPDFTDETRKVYIGNNAYYFEDYMLDWYTDCGWCQARFQARESDEIHLASPPIGENAMAFYDSVDGNGDKVFTTMNIDTFYTDPVDFVVAPTNQADMLTFMNYKWGSGDDIIWAFKLDETIAQTWPLSDDLAYNNTTYQTAAWGGYPLGDLNWFPAQKAAWEASQRDEDWKTINNWLTTGKPTSTENPGLATPSGYRLNQNYPNPFNPTTTITYSVPNAGAISLKVYNTLGQEVATLFEGTKKAGNYEVTFDATGFSSGVYYYRLESASGASITKKLTLIK